MPSTFPDLWLVLALPFVSAAVIAHAAPLRALVAAHHRITWTVGVIGLCTFLAGVAGRLPVAWTIVGVAAGGALSGFACFWTRRHDDGGDDWRRGAAVPNDDPPSPGVPDLPIDWAQFDRLRSQWAGRPRVRR